MTVLGQVEPLDHDHVRKILRDRWGVEAQVLIELGGELDASIRVVDETGAEYCLKMRRTSASAAGEVGLELAALRHVRANSSVPVPAPRQTTTGEFSLQVNDLHLWLLDWIPGQRWVDIDRPGPGLERDLGATARRLARALATFDHAHAARTHSWDLRMLDENLRKHLDQCTNDDERAVADKVLRLLETRVAPVLATLPTSIVHQDINDHNVIYRDAIEGDGELAVIDFGDTLEAPTICELAVAMAYGMLRSAAPVDSAVNVAAGWFGEESPTNDELAVLFPLAMGRLLLNALVWSSRRDSQPEYATARSSHTWATLHAIAGVPAQFVDTRILLACRGAVPRVRTPSSEVRTDLSTVAISDLDPGNELFDSVDLTNPDLLWQAAVGDEPALLPHDRVRLDHGSFADGAGGPATIQAGAEIVNRAQTPLVTAISGTATEVAEHRVIISHDVGDRLWSCWTSLDTNLRAGDRLKAGDPVGTARGSQSVNVQLLTFEPDPLDEISRLVRPVDRDAWMSVSIDPSPVLGIDPDRAGAGGANRANSREVTALRNSRLAASQRYYYDEPMTLVRSQGVRFVDSDAHHYLDVINNVTHVGHGNAHVASRIARQLTRLNTNSRFVYEQMGAYADRLVSLLPDPLDVVFLVCTGSEANDLAIRIARQVTGRTNVMVVDGAYHGNTGVVTGISPNRYNGPGGEGPPPSTHAVMRPDRYRGPYGYDDAEAAANYADDVRAVAQCLVAADAPPAAFIAESLMGTAGQVVYPDGYLAEAFAHVRDAGGFCISDEVQVGFGRLGETFWGFELGGVVPDIVTMGKPMGNGHPIAAVVTSREIADAFDQGMKYFNTFGGNPVSCAAASAVLDEIERLDLQAQARRVGAYFKAQLCDLMDSHEIIGDVRGEGMYLGVEFVHDRATKEPAKAFTSAVCERLREYGVIMYPNGELGNSLKIKPPMVFDESDVDRFVERLDRALTELA